MADEPLIPPNTIMKDPGGKQWIIGAITFTGGERYYFLTEIHKRPTISMMPAFVVEQWERL